VIGFLTLQGLKANDIQTEVELVYENGVLEVGAVKNGDRVYCMGESTLEMARGPEDPPTLIFLMESARCSKGGCSFLAKSYQGTSGSPRTIVFGFSMKVWDREVQFKMRSAQV
jgi:hypothetical protein